MHRNRLSILTLSGATLIGLAGCDRAAEPVVAPAEPTAPVVEAASVSATYVCDSGLTVAVAYPDPQSAQVTYRDRTYVLRSTQTASGARYRDAEVEWRTATRAGVEEAVLNRIVDRDATVPLERCRRPAPAPVTPVVPVPVPIDPAAPGGVLPASAPCLGPQLRLSSDGGDAGAGNRVAVIGVRNIGTSPCSLTGYPTVVLQDRQGDALASVRSEETLGSYFRQSGAPAPVLLEPQVKAFFDIAWTVVPNETEGQKTCPTAGRIRMTAPDDTSPVSLAQVFTPCGGRIRVSPFRPVAEPVPAPAT